MKLYKSKRKLLHKCLKWLERSEFPLYKTYVLDDVTPITTYVGDRYRCKLLSMYGNNVYSCVSSIEEWLEWVVTAEEDFDSLCSDLIRKAKQYYWKRRFAETYEFFMGIVLVLFFFGMLIGWFSLLASWS